MNEYIDMTVKILVIIILAGIVGLDRELRHKPAGTKTHILVGLGSTVFTIMSIWFYQEFQGRAQVDPSRIAAQIVTGIGFLGAGTIIQFGGSVIGLTTAASLWSVAAIGIAVGTGNYFLAAITTGAMVLIFSLINRFTDMLENKVVPRIKRARRARNKSK
jgi:putative Mg2+ transporter-C (MgtC) family protein